MLYHLNDLPPVTFNSLDVSCLVRKIERLSAVIASMKNAVSEQSIASENLRGHSHRKPVPGPSALAVTEETAGGGVMRRCSLHGAMY